MPTVSQPWFRTEQLLDPETLDALPEPETVPDDIHDLLGHDATNPALAPAVPIDIDSEEYAAAAIEFWAYVKGKYPMSAASLKTYRSGLRRIERDFGPLDYYDPVVIDQYRLSMKPGTRSVFDYVWTYWREAELALGGIGWVRAEIPPMSRVRFAHPLCSDLTTLSGLYRLDDLAEMRWQDVKGKHKADKVEDSFLRIYEFQRRHAASDIRPADFIIPAGSRNEPMKPWRMEYIINSEGTATASPTERFAAKLANRLSLAGFSGLSLRQYMTALWMARASLNRSSIQHEAFDALRTALDNKQYTTLLRLMEERWPKTRPTLPLW
jgi:hypothetical protein